MAYVHYEFDYGYDYDDGDACGYDYDDGDAYGYDGGDVYGCDGAYEGNGDGDYGLDIACDDKNPSEDIASSKENDDDVWYIARQVERIHLECDGSSNGKSGKARTRKYEIGIKLRKVILEFDGASKGNPGKAGGGAVLKSEDGTVIIRVREGLGEGTNNDAEYRSLIRGLKTALDMGYGRIHAKGDSQLVVEQVRGKWQTRNDKMAKYKDEVRKLVNQFKEFEISHFPRVYNSEADAEARKAVNLPAGRIQQEYNWQY